MARSVPGLILRRGWLSGLRAWEVHHNGVLVAHVLKETEGTKWAVFFKGDDEYDDLLYDFDTREQVLKHVVKTLKERAK
jgi:hypothetical protein